MSAEEQAGRRRSKNTIDRVLPTVRTFDDFLAAMRREGYEVRQDGKYLKFRAVGAGQERYTRAKTLGADYTEEALRERVGRRSDSRKTTAPGERLTLRKSTSSWIFRAVCAGAVRGMSVG